MTGVGFFHRGDCYGIGRFNLKRQAVLGDDLTQEQADGI
jgi:hypothetical protein